MRVCIVSGRIVKRLALCAVCAATALLLLRFPAAAASGVARGLSVCAKQLIPSLFPFLVLTGFIIKSGIAADAVRVLTHRIPLLRGRGQALTVLLLSMLGGYPTGALAVVGSIRQSSLSEADGKALLRCAVHAAPAFVIGGVGVGMLGSVQAGILLWIAHLLAAVLLWPLWRPLRPTASSARATALPLSRAITDSLNEAAATLLSMAGCILAAATLLSLIDALGGASITSPWIRAMTAWPLEVTTACLEAAACGVHAPFFLGLALGFGGLSVNGQIAALTADDAPVDRGFFAARLLHGLLGGCLSLLLFRWFAPPMHAAPAVAGWSSAAPTAQSGAAATALLLFMGVIFLASLPHEGILRTPERRFS